MSERLCAKCGQPAKLMLQPGGKGPRTYQCIHCDRPDPMKSAKVRVLVDRLAPLQED